ncbi:AraC family ligand binding domain-containing protein [Photobacterium sp. 1_MG-2023]|uniref:AraC family ligand binding domain-containing protein n=1 Tax=Photobacterium sp. 1_MG-2023 TaxID=3062646 RepID=UPI0026E20E3E|nr:AraC family ligand binding domain-containing protein [Photobacterium sp. 1_MG-2023]MDO6706992.1 AraC family ligand binding domain-containing protein [Photobacterium sp. 1_MG-2023]
MNQAIEYTQHEPSQLFVGARKKNVTAYLIAIQHGVALLRLGKHEFALTQGTGFWLPFDCLHALTVLPGCRYHRIDFSARLTLPYPEQAGFITVSPLLQALLDELNRLSRLPVQSKHSSESRVLAVVADQLTVFKPSTQQICPALTRQQQSSLAALLESTQPPSKDSLSAIESVLGISANELEACLLVREALKLSRSGRKAEQIAKTLHCQLDHLQALGQTLTGKQF